MVSVWHAARPAHAGLKIVPRDLFFQLRVTDVVRSTLYGDAPVLYPHVVSLEADDYGRAMP